MDPIIFADAPGRGGLGLPNEHAADISDAGLRRRTRPETHGATIDSGGIKTLLINNL